MFSNNLNCCRDVIRISLSTLTSAQWYLHNVINSFEMVATAWHEDPREKRPDNGKHKKTETFILMLVLAVMLVLMSGLLLS